MSLKGDYENVPKRHEQIAPLDGEGYIAYHMIAHRDNWSIVVLT